MIKSKYIDRIVLLLTLAAMLFASVIIYRPDIFGAEELDAGTEYETALFGDDMITIDIRADEDDWNGMLENATAEQYISCDVTVNGTVFGTVGIRPKGNSSLSTVAKDNTTDRFSFKIEFDHYIAGQTCFGLDKLALNNIQADTTYMKEYISYDLMDFIGVTTPFCGYANITVNGKSWGLYLAVEALEASFAERNFGRDYGMLYKPESMGNRGNGKMQEFIENNMENETEAGDGQAAPPAGNAAAGNVPAPGGPPAGGGMAPDGGKGGNSGGGCSLLYTDESVSSYLSIFENAVFDANESDYARVIEALKNLNSGTELETYVNVDETLRYFAANTVLVNLDSYVSSMQHNYYLYEEGGQISILPWDYNLAFGGFQAKSASDAINFPIDTPVSGVELSARPLLSKLLEVPEYKERYHEYLQQIVDDYFESGYFGGLIDELDAKIGDSVRNDATSFVTFEEFEESLPQLKLFGELRALSVEGQLDGTIPSTEEGQTENSGTLIDASLLNLSALGTQGGGGAGRTNQNNNQMPGQNGEFRAVQGEMPDMEIMQKAAEIINGAGEAGITEEQRDQLYALGLSDEQIEMLESRTNAFAAGGGPPGPRQGGGELSEQNGQIQQSESGKMRNPLSGEQANEEAGKTGAASSEWIALCFAAALLGLFFVWSYKRKRLQKGGGNRSGDAGRENEKT